MNATTKQEAALHIIMGELAPLIKEAQELTETFKQVHEEINDDLMRLGAIAQNLQQGHTAYHDDVKQLAKYVDGKMSLINTLKQTPAASEPIKINFWVPALVSAILSASIAAGAVYYLTSSVRENAQLGLQLKNAWPALDKQTKDKLNKAFAQ